MVPGRMGLRGRAHCDLTGPARPAGVSAETPAGRCSSGSASDGPAAHMGRDELGIRLHMPLWVLGMLVVIYLERVITVRKAGLKGILLAFFLIPEWCYGMFDGLYLFQALRIEIMGRDLSWGHVVRRDARHVVFHDIAAAFLHPGGPYLFIRLLTAA